MRFLLACSCLLSLIACSDRPSRAEALQAFREKWPGVDSGPVRLRIWADGPPWFSCAEVLAKLKSNVDRQVVRDPLRHWGPLINAEWAVTRDTMDGPVVDPGWCALKLKNEVQLTGAGWSVVAGDTTPTGTPRRGWDVMVGLRKVAVPQRTTPIGKDSAQAGYVLTVVPNASGTAVGADQDTVTERGLLAKVDGRWRLVRMDSTP